MGFIKPSNQHIQGRNHCACTSFVYRLDRLFEEKCTCSRIIDDKLYGTQPKALDVHCSAQEDATHLIDCTTPPTFRDKQLQQPHEPLTDEPCMLPNHVLSKATNGGTQQHIFLHPDTQAHLQARVAVDNMPYTRQKPETFRVVHRYSRPQHQCLPISDGHVKVISS